MAKRAKIEIAKDDQLQEIDDELDLAMDHLDGANARVDDILAGNEELALVDGAGDEQAEDGDGAASQKPAASGG